MTSSGLARNASLTATISPDTGVGTSDAVFTDSTTTISSPALTLLLVGLVPVMLLLKNTIRKP